jgi:hypothetical protein
VLDFGEQGHNQRPQLALTLENTGAKPLRITKIDSTCSCLKVRPASLTEPLLPGVPVRLNVTMSSGRAVGFNVQKYLEIYAGKSKPLLKIPARMRIFAGFDLEPHQLRFAGEFGGKAVTETVELKWIGRRRPPAKITFDVQGVFDARGRRLGDHFKPRLEDIRAGKRLQLTLRPTLPEGRIFATVRARLNGLPFEISVTGEMFRGIKVVPNYLNFNRAEVEKPETLVEEARLTAIGAGVFKILETKVRVQRTPLPGLQLHIEPEAKEAGKEYVLRARLQLPPDTRAQGSFFGKVRVKTDHPLKPELELNFFGFLPKR